MASDDFNGSSNGDALTTHNSSWTDGANVADLEIQSDECTSNQSFSTSRTYFDGSQNNFSQLISRGGGDESGPRVSVFIQLAHTVSTDEGYHAELRGSATNWTAILLEKDGTFVTQTTGLSVDPAKSADVLFKITGTVNGSDLDLEMFLDGVSELFNTNSSPLTGGFDGFGGRRQGASQANFTVDNWTSDAVVAGAMRIQSLMENPQMRHALTR